MNKRKLPVDKRILAACLLLAGCGSDAAVELPLGTTQMMMANEVQPAADTYWQSVRFESRLLDDGTVQETDFVPESDADWDKVRAAAVRLGELGEILQTPAYSDERGADWIAFSQGLVDVAARAEQAALDKDPDAVFEVGGYVYNVCKACHQMYPPEELPEGAEVGQPRPTDDVPLDEYLESGSDS